MSDYARNTIIAVSFRKLIFLSGMYRKPRLPAAENKFRKHNKVSKQLIKNTEKNLITALETLDILNDDMVGKRILLFGDIINKIFL